MRRQSFIVTPWRVEQLVGDDGESCVYPDATLFGDLLLAGYPASDDRIVGSCFIDLSVDLDDLTEVVVYACCAPPGGHRMGEVAGLFLAWHRINVVNCWET